MKKQLLLSSALLAAISVYSQDGQIRTSGKVNSVERIAQRDLNARKAELASTTNNNTTAAPAVTHSAANAKTASPPVGTWGIIGGSRNSYGVLYSAQKPLQYNAAINAVSFVHRASNTYPGSPANNSGTIMMDVTTNWGTSFDSTAIWSDATNLARYPQGGIYNPPGNTNINSAYGVVAGPVTGGSGWQGSFFASKQLGSANYNPSASGAPGAMQFIASNPVTPAIGKMDFPAYGFNSSADGKIHVLGEIVSDINGTTNLAYGYRGLNIVKGTFNSGVFNWTGDSLLFDPIVRTNSSSPADPYKMISGRPFMAWNEAGTIGYVAVIGVRATPTNSQSSGYQPIVWKTTNSGASWSSVPAIDFASPTYSNVMKRIDPTSTNTNVTIPQFNTGEGFGLVVDANGLLHFVGTIQGTY
ncbi:MAG: BNR/Asp-box repeat protein, partial [Bacteroidetes bacterium]|nr:BNR/Asp-box repeat protein [Bacteroidota bacterium]